MSQEKGPSTLGGAPNLAERQARAVTGNLRLCSKGDRCPRKVPGRSRQLGGAQATVRWVLILFSCLSLAERPHPKAFISNQNTAVMTFKAQGGVISPTYLGGIPVPPGPPRDLQTKSQVCAEEEGGRPQRRKAQMREDGARGPAPRRPVPGLQRGQDGCPHRQARGVDRSGASLSVHDLLCDLAFRQAG